MENTKLSNIQMELLKLYSRNIPDEELLEVKKILAEYFSRKAIEEADVIWETKGYSNQKIENLLNYGKL
jgi:hypothetical protein